MSATRNRLSGKFMIFCIFVIILVKVIAVVIVNLISQVRLTGDFIALLLQVIALYYSVS